MLRLKDVLETLKGHVTLYLRDGKPDDLIVCEPIPADELRDRILKTGMRFFNYHILEMYAIEDIDNVLCIKIVLVR